MGTPLGGKAGFNLVSWERKNARSIWCPQRRGKMPRPFFSKSFPPTTFISGVCRSSRNQQTRSRLGLKFDKDNPIKCEKSTLAIFLEHLRPLISEHDQQPSQSYWFPRAHQMFLHTPNCDFWGVGWGDVFINE